MLTDGVRRVGVLGAGMMGRGIAAVFAAAGREVMLYDSSPDVLADAVRELAGAGHDVAAVTSPVDLAREADLVTEAVVEDLEVKQSLFAELSAADEHTVLATNTSVLPVSAVAAYAVRPERVLGTHWWNPPGLIPVVEVVRGERTGDDVLDTVTVVLTEIGKLPVRVERDVPGFIGNRLQHALWREAIALVADGVCDAPTVDLVVRNTVGLRLAALGPLENADLVGLDLTLAIHETVLRALNADPEPSPLLRRLVEGGRLGAKTGTGFLDWPDGSRDATSDRLRQHVRAQLLKTESA